MGKIELVTKLQKLKARRAVVLRAINALENLEAEFRGRATPSHVGRTISTKNIADAKVKRERDVRIV